jgi:hypothetical protein
MAPFASKSQARGAFSGAFGPKMKAHAKEWAKVTPGGIKSLPERKGKKGKKKKRVGAGMAAMSK